MNADEQCVTGRRDGHQRHRDGDTKMTRQQKRYEQRRQTKTAASQQKVEDRIAARRANLRRQKARAVAGFYGDARTTASRMSPSRSRVSTRTVQKGQPFGRIIRKVGIFALHATKGWRLDR